MTLFVLFLCVILGMLLTGSGAPKWSAKKP